MVDPNQILEQFYAMELTETVLPLLLFFLIIYHTSKSLKALTKPHRVILSLAISALIVFLHVSEKIDKCWDPITILHYALPKIGVAAIITVSFVLLVAMIGFKLNLAARLMGYTAISAFALVIYTFLTSRGPGCPTLDIDIPLIKFIIPVVVFLALAWYMTKGKDDPSIK